jgi:hypothetical protein
VNGARDELLACASLSLDEHSGIRRRDVFDLLEHPFQRGTVAYDLLKSMRGSASITTVEHLGNIHCGLQLICFLTSSPFTIDPLADVCRAIPELDAISLAAPKKANYVLIHQRQIIQVQNCAVIVVLFSEQRLKLTYVFSVHSTA